MAHATAPAHNGARSARAAVTAHGLCTQCCYMYDMYTRTLCHPYVPCTCGRSCTLMYHVRADALTPLYHVRVDALTLVLCTRGRSYRPCTVYARTLRGVTMYLCTVCAHRIPVSAYGVPCMRRGSPFSMGSTVRDDPRRSGHLRGALYAFQMTGKILAPLEAANSISRSRDLGRRCTNVG